MVHCNSSHQLGRSWKVDQFWFYSSDFKIKVNGRWQSINLSKNNWQQDNVALIGMHCDESNDRNWKLSFSDNLLGATALTFKIAVPFESNHQNPLKASGIFDNSNMFWTWQQGYKALRLDMSSSDENWAFHIGAIGCQSPSVLRAPRAQCRNSNHVDVTINNFSIEQPINIDLSLMVKNVELSHENRCLSMPTQGSCSQLMNNMTSQKSAIFYQEGKGNE